MNVEFSGLSDTAEIEMQNWVDPVETITITDKVSAIVNGLQVATLIVSAPRHNAQFLVNIMWAIGSDTERTIDEIREIVKAAEA